MNVRPLRKINCNGSASVIVYRLTSRWLDSTGRIKHLRITDQLWRAPSDCSMVNAAHAHLGTGVGMAIVEVPISRTASNCQTP